MSLTGSKGKSKQQQSQKVDLPPWLENSWQSAIGDAQSFGANNPIQAYAPDTARIQSLMNPEMNAVIGTTLGGIDRQRQERAQEVGDAATAARAFGGSRHGLLEAQTNAEFDRIAADTEAQLRAAAFDRALGLDFGEFQRAQQRPLDLMDLRLRALGMAPQNNNMQGQSSGSNSSFGFGYSAPSASRL